MGDGRTDEYRVTGEFTSIGNERFYAIRNVDHMAPFFVSVVSDDDHWLFAASNGGLTAGRVSPDTALFPYVTVDKIYDSAPHTGPKTIFRLRDKGRLLIWEPFNREHDFRYRVRRNLYKNSIGNKLLFEEINEDLNLAFRYCWSTSREFGFVRESELENLGDQPTEVDFVDGVQNLLPASTPRHSQTVSSYLVDAYKWNELDGETGLGFFTLFSRITDRAEPAESLRATTVFSLGLSNRRILLSDRQLTAFRTGGIVTQEDQTRGIRGAYFVQSSATLPVGGTQRWRLVTNVEQGQAETVALRTRLAEPDAVNHAITESVERGCEALRRIMAAADGFQATAEETLSTHHYANVLFNVLRGGIFDDGYSVASRAFQEHLKSFNRAVFDRHKDFLATLPTELGVGELLDRVAKTHDPRLVRLAYEYLPITFGRRHGDPSRPWNQFAIKLIGEDGGKLLTYQGNWRDIFQNWEALLLGYPEFIESVIAKFVNASTADGYNPYRITNEGIDWEVEEPDDPWSYIGYWGDHQIIYLLKLLELSRQFHPDRLTDLLQRPVFSYANVPYRIKPYEALLENARSTVVYDNELAERLEERVAQVGADGKLIRDHDGQVYQVTLLEKLIVPLLAKLGNLVADGGIWLNTQRPEWNDANNALVGQGLSMVTLYYMRRYITFLEPLVSSLPSEVELSTEVQTWLDETALALSDLEGKLGQGTVSPELRRSTLDNLGQAASRYREAVYAQEGFTGTSTVTAGAVSKLLESALAAVDQSIRTNRREDGLYNAYNLLELTEDGAGVDTLYPMLEGQVAALSSGAIRPPEAADLLDGLFASSLFRADQRSFLLYPDRELPGFLEKNRVPTAEVEANSLLMAMTARGDRRLIEKDQDGCYRFHPSLTNAEALGERLDSLSEYGTLVDASREGLEDLYEQVFDHKSFTGRSGGMFGFEGLGSIYWHMVAKLLVATQEMFFASLDAGEDDSTTRRLGESYYRVREGIGFNKTPAEYGAFPTDPYSHTPGHAGAQQPGMTGQVKEEMLTRFAELGVRVSEGAVRFEPALLRAREFVSEPRTFRYLDVDGSWQEVTVPAHGLAFTWCQVPLVYRLGQASEAGCTVVWAGGERRPTGFLGLPAETAGEVFRRSGRVRRIDLVLTRDQLFGD